MGHSDEYRSELFTPETWPIDDDEAYDVLGAQRRRFVISCLYRHEMALPLADIADEIASWEHDAHLTDIPADDVKRIYLDLYHRHVPKLVDAGLIEYGQEADMVALTALAEEFLSD